MTWLKKLYDTYECAQGLDLDADEALMPISHTLQNAHVNIILDGEGNFRRAKVLEKTQVILPATESSAGRSSGEAPHPLADKLQYVAKDYAAFGGEKKNYFEGYLKQLSAWADSDFTHPSVKAVRAYVSKGTVVSDLIAAKVCHVNEQGKLLTSWDSEEEQPLLMKGLPKEKGKFDQGNALVCWTVEVPGQEMSDTWKDPSLHQAWIDFDLSQGSATAFCLVSGEEVPVASNHPAKLRNTGDKAKLISANDTSGYTFRGRFLESDQAATVGFEVTQKAHNALRWLISRQGNRNGDQVILSWAVSGKGIPQPFSEPDGWGDDEAEVLEPVSTGIDHSIDLGKSFAAALNKKLAGYRSGKKLELTDQIVVMALDSATPGRMAISYYRDFRPNEYFDNLERWHLDFAWWQRASKDKQEQGKPKWFLAAPGLWAMLQAIYGDIIKSNETLKKSLVERMLPSIIDKRPPPEDMEQRAFSRAVARQSFKQDEQWLWEQNLGVACALYRGLHARHPITEKRRYYGMALDLENRSRDYLYGRLLAVAENIEQFALDKAGEGRSTTAARLMQRFADRPYSAWRTIELSLQPYMQRLQSNAPQFLASRKRLLDEIQSSFDSKEFLQDNALSGEFLLAFHCQRLALTQKKTSERTEVTTKEGTEA